jgi:hypothetical protein
MRSVMSVGHGLQAVPSLSAIFLLRGPAEPSNIPPHGCFPSAYPAGHPWYDLDDPKRSVIPATVSKWIAANLGAVETGAPIAAASRAKREWETIVRPRRRSKKR